MLMRLKKFLIHPALIISTCFLILGYGCEKDNDSNDNESVDENGTIEYEISYDSVSDIEGNQYKTIVIGQQEWMAEDLKVTKYSNGDTILTGLNDVRWDTTKKGAYAIYDDKEERLEQYGALYNWYVIDDPRSICPDGWHVPSVYEWSVLTDYLENNYDAITSKNIGDKLKSCRQDGTPLGGDCDTREHPKWVGDDTHYGTDDFGFSALPGGLRESGGGYEGIGFIGLWWSSTEATGTEAFGMYMLNESGQFEEGGDRKNDGICIRCIKD